MLYCSGLRYEYLLVSFLFFNNDNNIILLSLLFSVINDGGKLYSSGLSSDSVKLCQYALKEDEKLSESYAKAVDLTETGIIITIIIIIIIISS